MSNKEKIKMVFSKLRTLSMMKTQKEFSPEMIEMFYDAIKEYSPDDILEAIRICSRTKTYGLQPSDLIQHLEASEEDLELKSSKIANSAFERFRHKMLEGRGELPSFEDEITQHAFNLTLEEGDWREDAEQFNKWFRVKMKKNLINLHSAPGFQQHLELKEAEEKKARAALYE